VSTIGALAVGFRAARDAKRASRVGASVASARVNAARIAARLSGAFGTIVGLGSITAAAWTVALPLGLLVAGLSAFVLEWRLAE
jgi:hypothetical protein